MQTGLIEKFISGVYANKSKVLIDSVSLRDLDDEQISILEKFHLRELYLIEAKDEYFCGIRADYFCVEYGLSEHFTDNKENSNDLILVTANHKGTRLMTLIRL